METLNLCEFNKLAEACGNRYVAIKWLSSETRRLFAKNRNYSLLESRVLTWALTGTCPYSRFELERRNISHKVDHIDELLEFVLDEDVCNEVRTFYKISVKNKQLTLCDRVDLGESRLERTNILLRMAWYNF